MTKKEKEYPRECLECHKVFFIKRYGLDVFCSNICSDKHEKTLKAYKYTHIIRYAKQDTEKLLTELPQWANEMKGAIHDDITPPQTETFKYARQMKYLCGKRIIQVRQLKNEIQVQY
jgi:hypothetical protein